MTNERVIYTTETDRERLGYLTERVRNQDDKENFSYIKTLEEKLEFAEAVAPEQIPPDVVTMRSKVKFMDLGTNEESTYTLVFPSEADFDKGKISILAPLATALLGCKCGDIVEFETPVRVRRLKIEEILYQPESAGDLNL